jgi:hypothetical protein
LTDKAAGRLDVMSAALVVAAVGAFDPPFTRKTRVVDSAHSKTLYFFGGLIMMCAPAVPGDISHGAPSLALVERPVDCGVANGT